MSVGYRISSGEGALGRRGSVVPAEALATEAPAEEVPTAEDSEIPEISGIKDPEAPEIPTAGDSEVLGIETATGANSLLLPAPISRSPILQSPISQNPTSLPTNNGPLRDKRSAYAVFRGSGARNLPRKIENI